MRRNALAHKTSVPGHYHFKASLNILQSLGFMIHVEMSVQPTKEICLHLKPVKGIFEFKTRSIRHSTRVLDLIILYLVRAEFGGAHYKRTEINETTKNMESAELHTLRDLAPCALLTLMPNVPRALCALVRPCLVLSVLSCLTYILLYMFSC